MCLKCMVEIKNLHSYSCRPVISLTGCHVWLNFPCPLLGELLNHNCCRPPQVSDKEPGKNEKVMRDEKMRLDDPNQENI